jgi:hypothetical protein
MIEIIIIFAIIFIILLFILSGVGVYFYLNSEKKIELNKEEKQISNILPDNKPPVPEKAEDLTKPLNEEENKVVEDAFAKEYERLLGLRNLTDKEAENEFLKLMKNPNFWIATGTAAVASMIAGKIIVKVLKITEKMTFSKMAYRFAIKGLNRAGRVFAKLGLKKGGAIAAKLGAKVAVNAASKFGTKLAVGSSAGPITTAAVLAFEALSFALDYYDVGGYGKLEGTLKKDYLKMQKGFEIDYKRQIEKIGGKYPVIIGPMDKLKEKDLEAKVMFQIKKIMNPNKSKPDPLIVPMFKAIIEDAKAGRLTEADLENEKTFDKYLKLIDMDKLFNKAMSEICKELKGKVITRDPKNIQCSYKTKTDCHRSYSWPLRKNNTYAEFKRKLQGGICIGANPSLRVVCEENGMKYDIEKGMCIVDKNYCAKRGADWEYDPEIREHDCKISKGQEITEFIFGATITRGLKQVFDPDQYKSCKPGEVDSGYLCREKCKPGYKDIAGVCWAEDGTYGRGVGFGLKAGDGLSLSPALERCENEHGKGNCEKWGAVIYPKCKKGFKNVGCCLCEPDGGLSYVPSTYAKEREAEWGS